MLLFSYHNIKRFLNCRRRTCLYMKKYVLLFLLVLMIEPVSAAILHGTIYDSNLNEMDKVVVEINSEPPQNFISKEGQYSFVLDTGNYILRASYDAGIGEKWYLEKNISIQRNGYFVVDLLFDEEMKNPGKDPFTIFYIVGLILVVLAAGLFFILRRKPIEKEEPVSKEIQAADDSLAQLIKIIKKEGGRTTQKDIRKELPLSEAKVSLMITELEEKGIVKKIKKGRGNIILLQKK